jgi:hypothetical protein
MKINGFAMTPVMIVVVIVVLAKTEGVNRSRGVWFRRSALYFAAADASRPRATNVNKVRSA